MSDESYAAEAAPPDEPTKPRTKSGPGRPLTADRKRPYPCGQCASRFGSKMELEEHQNSHTGEKPFECDACHARFNRRSTLWNHKRIHSDTKPFSCHVCGMTFKWKNSLKCHREMHARKNEAADPDDLARDVTYATAANRAKRPRDDGSFDLEEPAETSTPTARRRPKRSRPAAQAAAAAARSAAAGGFEAHTVNTSILQQALQLNTGRRAISPISASTQPSPPVDPVMHHPHHHHLHAPVKDECIEQKTSVALTPPRSNCLMAAPTSAAVLSHPQTVVNLHIIHHGQPAGRAHHPQQQQQPMAFLSPPAASAAGGANGLLRSPGHAATSAGGVDSYVPNVDFMMHAAPPPPPLPTHLEWPGNFLPQPPPPHHHPAAAAAAAYLGSVPYGMPTQANDGSSDQYVVKVLPFTEW